MILDLTRFEIVILHDGFTWHCLNCDMMGRDSVSEARAHRNYRSHASICRASDKYKNVGRKAK